MSRLPCGRFVYEVTSGRIKFGPKYYLPGERLGLTEEQALSLATSSQLRFIRALPAKSGHPRKLVPGEMLCKMAKYDMRRIPRKDLKRLAREEYGLILDHGDINSWIMEIMERKFYGLQRPGRPRKTVTE